MFSYLGLARLVCMFLVFLGCIVWLGLATISFLTSFKLDVEFSIYFGRLTAGNVGARILLSIACVFRRLVHGCQMVSKRCDGL